MIVSVLLALWIPASYEATTQLMPPEGLSGSGMALASAFAARAAGGWGAIAGDLLGLRNSGALFVGVMNSRTVQDRIIDEFNLQQVYHIKKMEDARKALSAHTGIGEDRKSGIITITVTDKSPQRAAEMSRAYAAELDRVIADVSTSSARRERLFLEERLRGVKTDLDEASKEFSQFASKNAAIDITAQGKAMVEAAARLQGQLISAESELHGLEAIYTDRDIRVRSLRARIAELRAQLQKLGGDKEAATQSTGAAAGLPESNSFPTIRKLPLLGVTYYDLYRKTKIQETVYELLTQQYELAKVEEAKEIPSVKILDAAVAPTKKSFPPRRLICVFGTALFFLGACAFVFAKGHYASMDPQDPGKLFAEEVAVTVRTRVATAAAGVGALLSRLRGRDAAAASAGEDDDAATRSQDSAEPENHMTRAAGQGSL
jgi:capsule polysaccharide export protein KpsE/RkpR